MQMSKSPIISGYGKHLLRFHYDFTAIDPNKHAREIATCIQNVGQKEDFMHSNFQMDIKSTMD